MACDWGVNPYDFANKIRDYVQSYVNQYGFTPKTVASLLCGNLAAKRAFEPGPDRGKPSIADNEPLTTLAMIMAYASGQTEPWGFSGGLYSIPSLADADWLRLIDLFRMAGISDAELTLMGWNPTSEQTRRNRVGSYSPDLPDLNSTYNPYGYVVVNPETGAREAATQETILGTPTPEPSVPEPEPNPPAGPSTGQTTTIQVPAAPPAPPAPPVSGAATGTLTGGITVTEVASQIQQTPAGQTGKVPLWLWVTAAVAAYFAIRKR